MKQTHGTYDVVIVGGGVSGTALLYALTKYTNTPRIALFEKYSEVGQVNSKGNNNSQTLHIGDIETNYSFEKAKKVKPAAGMIPAYVRTLSIDEQKSILCSIPKMALAVGATEVAALTERYETFRTLYTDLQLLDRDGIATVEPAIIEGRDAEQPIAALYTPHGHAVNFEALAKSFVTEAVKHVSNERSIDIKLGTAVTAIEDVDGGYCVHTKDGSVTARTVVVNADAYSLYFAKALGYGTEYSLIPVAGSFYMTKELLRGKVYTMQDKKLPFSAVHGDPDVQVPGVTRWGPTAKFFPRLESGNLRTIGDYFRSAGLLRWATWRSFLHILSDSVRFRFLLKNATYDIPVIGKRLFVKNIQKIVPNISASDVVRARGFGGMRLQRVDVQRQTLELGEGKIIGDKIMFNMTPSPGASVCLYNAMLDAEQVTAWLGTEVCFDKVAMERAYGIAIEEADTTTINTYVS